jgi:hypothetical protein
LIDRKRAALRAIKPRPSVRAYRLGMIDIDRITGEIRALEHQLEEAFAKQRAGLNFGLERGRIQFEAEVARRHRALKRSLALYLIRARPLVVITAPLIYSLIIPFALADLWVSLYQAVCFRVYGIPQVKRGRYFILDRAGLPYLNALEKLNCAYCSYVNGVVAYVREVAARTEQYWCPIKHAKRVLGAHPRYAAFEDYGDSAHYQQGLMDLRRALASEKDEAAVADAAPLAETP